MYDTDIYDDYNELQNDYKIIKDALSVISKDYYNLNEYVKRLKKNIDLKDKEIEILKSVQIDCTNDV